jgi:hypothetical protein
MHRPGKVRSALSDGVASPSDKKENLLSGHGRVLMLPETEHMPAGPAEGGVGVTIAVHIGSDLLPPPCRIGSGPGAMAWAPVPKTAVYEHGQSGPGENKIYSTSTSHNRSVYTKAQAEPMDRSS